MSTNETANQILKETISTKKCCHSLADFYEALDDFENELKELRFKVMMEDNPPKKAWFLAAQERLLREKCELEEMLKQFKIKYS